MNIIDVYIAHSIGLTNKAIRYAKQLEDEGKKIYLPAKQTKKWDNTAKEFLTEHEIMEQKISAIKTAKEVHVLWDGSSPELIFELGIAYGLEKKILIKSRSTRPIDRFLREIGGEQKKPA